MAFELSVNDADAFRRLFSTQDEASLGDAFHITAQSAAAPPLGVEVGCGFCKPELFPAGGATLNVIGYDLDSQVSWYRAGHSRALTTERWRSSDTELKIGLYGGLAAKYPLTADGKIYLEAHGSYRWVDPVHASAGFADVEIDPSSWEGGLGIGIVLP